MASKHQKPIAQKPQNAVCMNQQCKGRTECKTALPKQNGIHVNPSNGFYTHRCSQGFFEAVL